jgi:predicted DNA-binding protein with PD1-like motif
MPAERLLMWWRMKMEYTVGSVGRVVVARLFEGEDLQECVGQIARTEGIRCATVLITGGFRESHIVVGPRQEEPTIEPRFQVFDGPGEVLGVGTLFWNETEPRLHIHAAIGKDGESLIGCPRHDTRTFLILEVTIIEITGIDAARRLDPKAGMYLLRLGATERPA